MIGYMPPESSQEIFRGAAFDQFHINRPGGHASENCSPNFVLFMGVAFPSPVLLFFAIVFDKNRADVVDSYMSPSCCFAHSDLRQGRHLWGLVMSVSAPRCEAQFSHLLFGITEAAQHPESLSEFIESLPLTTVVAILVDFSRRAAPPKHSLVRLLGW